MCMHSANLSQFIHTYTYEHTQTYDLLDWHRDVYVEPFFLIIIQINETSHMDMDPVPGQSILLFTKSFFFPKRFNHIPSNER